MSGYPDCETYKALYKRFYEGRSARELLDFAGDVKFKRVLDLCAGDGRLSIEALKLGAKTAWLVEAEDSMIPENVRQNQRIIKCIGYAEKWLLDFEQSLKTFDLVFCKQGVNYWLDEDSAALVADILEPRGIFIFNTFSNKPPQKPTVKEYELDGKKFVEVSWMMINDVVHHVQIREGMEPHTTFFGWLSPEYLEKILSPYFSIEVKNEGASALYRCSRK